MLSTQNTALFYNGLAAARPRAAIVEEPRKTRFPFFLTVLLLGSLRLRLLL